MSVSCDNYLGDGKFSLTRRDSVGSGSPHSSKVASKRFIPDCKLLRYSILASNFQGSPLRWAAKADEIGMTSSVTSACSPLRDEAAMASHQPQQSIEQRSCSANQLDVIVDILGVPSELLSQRDSNKRLFLLRTKDKMSNAAASSNVLRRRPRRGKTAGVPQGGSRAPLLDIEAKSRSCEEQNQEQDLLMEVKRRSIYHRDCRGRTEAQACNKCQVVAHEVKDMELNREIFDIDDDAGPDPEANEAEVPEVAASALTQVTVTNAEEEIIQVVEDSEEVNDTTSSLETKEAESDLSKKSGKHRRFDTVRGLLEKVRVKLLTTKQHWSRSLSRSRDRHSSVIKDTKPKELLAVQAAEAAEATTSQSSPNTPAQLRKEKRHRSFSPVRYLRK